jgi:hypothetical protein
MSRNAQNNEGFRKQGHTTSALDLVIYPGFVLSERVSPVTTYLLSLFTSAYAGDTTVKVLTPPWNPDVEPANVTLVVGRNPSGPGGSGGVGFGGEFYLKWHPRSANPASLILKLPHPNNKALWSKSRDLGQDSAPFFFNSGDIFVLRKSIGRHQPFLSAYEICELYDMEFALLYSVAPSK